MHAREVELTREWNWGIAIVGDPAGNIPDLDPHSVATVGDDTVILLVRHAQDLRPDGQPATSTVHVRVLDAHQPHERSTICDVVLNTPSHAVTLGDADGEATVAGLSSRTRLVVSAADARSSDLDELWIDLIVL